MNVRREEPVPSAQGDRRREVSWKLVGAIVLAALAIIFIFQNTDKSSIEFLFFDWEVGTWFGLLVTFLLGLLTGWLLPRFLRKKD